MTIKIRYEYGAKRRPTGEIVQKPLKDIKDQCKTVGLQYILGEIYRRPAGSDEPWERCD